jgi:hypothetical protein
MANRSALEKTPQSFLEIHLRLPAEHLTGACDVGLTHLRIVHGTGFEHDLGAP